MVDSLRRLSPLRLAAAMALVALLTVGPGATRPAGAVMDLAAGACVFPSANVSFSSPVTAVPKALTMAISGSGTCVANYWTGTGSFYLSVGSSAFSCEAGVAFGAGSFTFEVGGFTAYFDPALIIVEHVGGTFHMTANFNGITFTADGAFELDPTLLPACAGSGISGGKMTGGYAFEDPVIHTE